MHNNKAKLQMASTDVPWAVVRLFLTRGKHKDDVVPHSSMSVCALGKCKAELAVAKTPATPKPRQAGALVTAAGNRSAKRHFSKTSC